MPRFCSAPPSRSLPPVPPRPRTASIRPSATEVGDDGAQPLAHLRDGHVAATGTALDARGEVGEVHARPGGHLGGGDVRGEVRLAEHAAVDDEDVDVAGEQGVSDVGVLGALGVQGAGEADDGLAGHGHSFVTGEPGVVRGRTRRARVTGRSWSAVQTRSGVSGRSRMTTPVASATAAPRAPAVHSRAPSLMPFEPYGPGAVVVLDGGGEQLDRDVLEGGDPVVERAEVADAAVLVEQQLLHLAVAEAHDRGALVLGDDLQRVELGADVADGHVPGEQQLAGLAVDLDLDRGGVELVERRVAAERVLALAAQPPGALADELAAQRAERLLAPPRAAAARRRG